MIILRGEKWGKRRLRDWKPSGTHIGSVVCFINDVVARFSFAFPFGMMMMMRRERYLPCQRRDDRLLHIEKQCTKNNVLITKLEWIKQDGKSEERDLAGGERTKHKNCMEGGWKGNKSNENYIYAQFSSHTIHEKKSKAKWVPTTRAPTSKMLLYTLNRAQTSMAEPLRCVRNLLEY